MNDLLYISCPARRVRDVIDELGQQLTAAGIEHHVALYGNTQKINEGFAFLLSIPGFPVWFLDSLRQDETVSDFVLCSVDEKEDATR